MRKTFNHLPNFDVCNASKFLGVRTDQQFCYKVQHNTAYTAGRRNEWERREQKKT